MDSNNSGTYTRDNSTGCLTSLTVTNSVNANGDPAGIVAIYPEGMGEVQNAEVTNLLVTWHLPTGLVDSFNITLGNWTYLGSYSVADSVLDYQESCHRPHL